MRGPPGARRPSGHALPEAKVTKARTRNFDESDAKRAGRLLPRDLGPAEPERVVGDLLRFVGRRLPSLPQRVREVGMRHRARVARAQNAGIELFETKETDGQVKLVLRMRPSGP